MEKYELTILLDGKTTAAKKKKITETVEKMISLVKGKVGKVEDWGVMDLAYKIKKSETGLYLFFPLELGKEAVKTISSKMGQEDGVLRYLLVRVEE